jgi:hypothetical protein
VWGGEPSRYDGEELAQSCLGIRDEFPLVLDWHDSAMLDSLEIAEAIIWRASTVGIQSCIACYLRLCAAQRWLYFRAAYKEAEADNREDEPYVSWAEVAKKEGVDEALLPIADFDSEMLDFSWDQLAALDVILRAMYQPSTSGTTEP